MTSFNFFLRLAAVSAALAVAACVPLLPHTDYMPQMAGGTVLKDRCWGFPSVEYIGRDITLTSRVIRWPSDQLRLEVMFDIPEGFTVTPRSELVSVAAGERGRRDIAIEGISRNGNPALPMAPAGNMVGYNLNIGGVRSPGHFWLYVPLKGVDTGDFTVALPPLEVNGSVAVIPPMHFSKALRLQVAAPLQC